MWKTAPTRSFSALRLRRYARLALDKAGPWGLPLLLATLLALWGYTRSAEINSGMPSKVVDAAEEELYLTAGGLYSAADIKANGGLTASQKYPAFRAQHDFNPQLGDLICPITRTKANASCTWIVNGDRYAFCCPPCIDEFLILAKQQPDAVLPAEGYRR